MNFKIRINNQEFQVRVGNLKERPILVDVDGDTIEVWPEERSEKYDSRQPGQLRYGNGSVDATPSILEENNDAILPTSPIVNSTGLDHQRSKSILAPIPGVITAVFVTSGSEVSIGQELVKLEAMKMNNSIRSNRAGRVSAVHVVTGQMVKLNQVLLEYA